MVNPWAYSDEHDLIDPGQPALPLLHDHRLEGAVPVPGHLDLDLPGGLGQHRLGPGPVADVGRVPVLGGTVLLMAQVLGHLLVQRGLQHALGELLEQPVRTGQGQALLLGQPDQLLGRQLLSRGLWLLLRTHNIQCRHHGTFPAELTAQRVGPETPLDPAATTPERQALARRADGAALVRRRNGRGVQPVPPRERPPPPAALRATLERHVAAETVGADCNTQDVSAA